MNVLILTAKFGMGHNSVARALTEEIYNIDRKASVEVVDLLEYTNSDIAKIIYGGFYKLVEDNPEFYNKAYEIVDRISPGIKIPNIMVENKIKRLLVSRQPDFIISTVPICARTISAFKEKYRIGIPLVTCITDVGINSEWITYNTDIYLVASREVKDALIEEGIEEGKIYIMGIPIRREFKESSTRKRSNKKKILILGGGLGLMPNIDKLLVKLNKLEDLEISIITGKNKKIYEELKAKYVNINVLGFVDNMEDYMRQSDLIISKAGGITLFESIFSETPLLVIDPFLAQEIDNAKFIENRRIGRVIWREEDLEEILSLIRDENQLEEYRWNIKKIKCSLDENLFRDVVDDLGVVVKNEADCNFRAAINL